MSTPAPPTFPLSRAATLAAGAVFTAPGTTGSTNADLLALAPEQPHGSVLATLDQTAGRGRLDRTWSAPAGETLAVSLLVRADLDERDRGWLPLVAGAAMRDAIGGTIAFRGPAVCDDGPGDAPDVLVKWPNDVQIGGRKVCGILCQVAVDGSVVVGAGVNLTIPADRLPTPTSTSMAVAGAHGSAAELADEVLVAFHGAVLEAVAALVAGGPAAETVRSRVRSACGTIGQRVRLELPDGTTEEADATGIDDEGRITIRDRAGVTRGVAVGTSPTCGMHDGMTDEPPPERVVARLRPHARRLVRPAVFVVLVMLAGGFGFGVFRRSSPGSTSSSPVSWCSSCSSAVRCRCSAGCRSGTWSRPGGSSSCTGWAPGPVANSCTRGATT
ncbi:biotin--[acetyl-CoA-carboxylase] ligase [Curtobacterium flaccumfaciens]|nr:biotin--[acetyl-CoA-carboxylase] ligase [Curtobacterium flaccumfaciens]